MTWTILVNGHDDLAGDEKDAYEQEIVSATRDLVSRIAALDGGHVTSATATTNTTGPVNVLE